MGNHDEACIEPGREFDLNEYARAGIAFARRELSDAQKAWLRNRPMRLDFGDFTAVHASLSDGDEWEYIFTPSDARRHFLFQDKPLCFCGHTHRPAVWTQEGRKVARLHTKRKRHLPVGRAHVGQCRFRRPTSQYAAGGLLCHLQSHGAFNRVSLHSLRLEGDPVEDFRGRSSAISRATTCRGTLRVISGWQIGVDAIRCNFGKHR